MSHSYTPRHSNYKKVTTSIHIEVVDDERPKKPRSKSSAKDQAYLDMKRKYFQRLNLNPTSAGKSKQRPVQRTSKVIVIPTNSSDTRFHTEKSEYSDRMQPHTPPIQIPSQRYSPVATDVPIGSPPSDNKQYNNPEWQHVPYYRNLDDAPASSNSPSDTRMGEGSPYDFDGSDPSSPASSPTIVPKVRRSQSVPQIRGNLPPIYLRKSVSDDEDELEFDTESFRKPKNYEEMFQEFDISDNAYLPGDDLSAVSMDRSSPSGDRQLRRDDEDIFGMEL